MRWEFWRIQGSFEAQEILNRCFRRKYASIYQKHHTISCLYLSFLSLPSEVFIMNEVMSVSEVLKHHEENRKLCELPGPPGTVFSSQSRTKARADATASTATSFACIHHSVFLLLSLRLWMSAWSIASKSPYVWEEVAVDRNFMERRLKTTVWLVRDM